MCPSRVLPIARMMPFLYERLSEAMASQSRECASLPNLIEEVEEDGASICFDAREMFVYDLSRISDFRLSNRPRFHLTRVSAGRRVLYSPETEKHNVRQYTRVQQGYRYNVM